MVWVQQWQRKEPVGRRLGNFLGGGVLSLSFTEALQPHPAVHRAWPQQRSLQSVKKGTSTWLMGWPGHIILDICGWSCQVDCPLCPHFQICKTRNLVSRSHYTFQSIFFFFPQEFSIAIYFSKAYLFIAVGSTIALQCCVSVCCMMKWISYVYTCILSLLYLLPRHPHSTCRGHHRTQLSFLQSIFSLTNHMIPKVIL